MSQAPPDVSVARGADYVGAPWFGTFALDFVTPQLQRGAAAWFAKRGVRTMPARSDLTIRDLKMLLPNLSIIEIVPSDPVRYRVRLMGSVLDEMVAPMTGRFIDEAVPAHFAQKWSSQWLPAIDERKPMRAVGRVEFAGRRWYVAESLYAPLAFDGETPDMLMVAAYYHSVDTADGATSDVAASLAAQVNAQTATLVS
ncbi:MAG: hypothetical protein SGI91_08330 [Alphaproteobacteria bacterium]|jgi:hypothetical protein|nr:hypothetical protein [Alphaproteobacteria bacterium]